MLFNTHTFKMVTNTCKELCRQYIPAIACDIKTKNIKINVFIKHVVKHAFI